MPQGIISNEYRRALVDLLEDFMATKGLDWESIRRAQWLRQHLQAPDQVAERTPLAAVG